MTKTPKLSPAKKKIGGGCCAILVLGFIVLWAIGTFLLDGEEPDQQPAATVEATTEPEEAEASEEATEGEAAAEEEPSEEEPTEEPEPAEETATEEATETAEAEPTEDATDSDSASIESIQNDLDIWFDGCEWETTENSGVTMSSCEKHEIGIIVGPGDSSVQGILDAMGEDASTGGYFIEDGVAVWSTDMGTVNMAWDALGTPGTPTQF